MELDTLVSNLQRQSEGEESLANREEAGYVGDTVDRQNEDQRNKEDGVTMPL